MVSYLEKVGCAGVVVDGCIRDKKEIESCLMPVYAVGFCPIGATKSGPGEVNVPISCGGQVVMPGDIIIADEDGVVCFDEGVYREIYPMVSSRVEAERMAMDLINNDIEAYKERRDNRVGQWTCDSGYYQERDIK